MTNTFVALLAGAVISFTAMTATAQSEGTFKSPKCRGPIYTAQQVAKKARMIGSPNFSALYGAFGNDVSGSVSLEAVFCRSGRVTDIRVIESRPPKIGEFVAAAVSLLTFTPAEMNWHTVSQRMQLEFSINDGGGSPIDAAGAAGRLIDEIDVMGNRRLTAQEIRSWIKSRPGDTFNEEQTQKDLRAILATGSFDSTSTRVLLEDAPRGGVRLVFEVNELPLIVEVRFEGLKEGDQSEIAEELRRQNAGVQKGVPLDPGKLKHAKQIIKQFFEAQGWRDVTTEALVEQMSATEVTIIFRINAYRFPL
jgi:hypothetical protein